MIEAFITGAVGAAIVAVIGNVVMFKLQRKAIKEDKADDKLKERIEAQEKEQAILRTGVEALLHLYRPYHDLGGNGTGTKLYEAVKNLPLSEEGGV